MTEAVDLPVLQQIEPTPPLMPDRIRTISESFD